MAEAYPIHFAGIAIETLPTGAQRWPCAAHGATVTAFLKPNGQWAVSASCRACNRAVLQPVLDAIEAAKKAPPVDNDGASDVVWRKAGNADVSSHHSIAPANGTGAPLSYAIAYARRGLGVFPAHDIERDGQCSCGKLNCSSAGKHPRLKDWQALATTNVTQIREWWRQWPNANIGVKCGADSNLTVLDVDGDEGRETLRALELEHGELPETPIAITGRGGAHCYFAYEPDVLGKARFAPGLDFRTEGNLVIGVGSRTTHPYEWEAVAPLGDDLPPARMPPWLAALSPKIRAAATSSSAHDPLAPEDARSMLTAVNADDRETWLTIGMALKSHYGMTGFGLWDAWSQKSAKYKEDDQRRTWDSIKVEGGTTIGTLIGLARDAGWSRRAVAVAMTNGKGPVQPASTGTASLILDLPDLTKKALEPLTWSQMQERRALQTREWIVEGKLARGETSSWSGKVEGGKTTLMRELTLCTVRGEPFLGAPVARGRVAYLMLDADGEDVTYDAFDEMGFTEDDGQNVLFLFEPMLAQIEQGLERLVALMLDFKPSLVIIDPYPRLKIIEDFHSYSNTYLMALLSYLAKRLNAHLALPGHIPRGRDDDADVATAGFGSISFSGGVNARFIVTNRNGTHTIRSSKGKGSGFVPFDGELILERGSSNRIALGAPWSWKDKARSQMGNVERFLNEHEDRPFDVVSLAREIRVQRSVVRSAAALLYARQSIRRAGEGLKASPFIYASLMYRGELTMEEVKRA